MGLDNAINFLGGLIPTLLIVVIFCGLMLVPLLIGVIKIIISVIQIFLDR